MDINKYTPQHLWMVCIERRVVLYCIPQIAYHVICMYYIIYSKFIRRNVSYLTTIIDAYLQISVCIKTILVPKNFVVVFCMFLSVW